METELILNRGGFPPFSARGCVQELSPIALGQFRRTINGDLVFLGTQGKKYRSIITCQDQAVMATDDLLPGVEVEVFCIQRLWQKTTGGSLFLERDPVRESVLALDEQRQPVHILSQQGRSISLALTGTCFVSYRPILMMRVIRYALSTNEWEGISKWHLELEEI